MKPISILNENSTDELYVDFTVGTVCNYKCHYCFDGLNDGQHKFPINVEAVTSNLSYLLSLYNKSKIRLHITGGEPTAWTGLEEFVSHFQTCKISLSTNGYRTVSWWKTHSHLFDTISISIHNEFCNVDHISEVLDWIYSTDTFVDGTVLMDPNNWSKCVSIVSSLQQNITPWLLKVRPIILHGSSSHYTEEQYQYMKDKIKKLPPQEYIDKMKDKISAKTKLRTTFDNGSIEYLKTINFFENNWHHFKGWKCNLGVDRLSIDRDGSINGSCGARNLFGLPDSLSIYDPNLQSKLTIDMIQPTICQLEYCDCPSNIKITKNDF